MRFGPAILLLAWSLIITTPLACATRSLLSTEFATTGWKEANTSGIRVLTNTDPELAMRSLRKLDRFLKTAHAIGGHELPDYPMTLHLFDRRVAYSGFHGGEAAGHTVRGIDGYFIALGSDDAAWTTHTLFHEVAHLLLHDHDYALPQWFHEGYSEYLASSILRPQVATVGRVLDERAETLRTTAPLGLERLFGTRDLSNLSTHELLHFYAESWAFVHFCMASIQSDVREPQLQRFIQLLSSGVEPLQALEPAFDQSLTDLERDYTQHRGRLARKTGVIYRHYVIPAIDHTIGFRPIASRKVDVDLGNHALLLQRYGVAFDHFSKVTEQAPGHPIARLGRAIALASVERIDEATTEIDSIASKHPLHLYGRGILEMIAYHLEKQSATKALTSDSAAPAANGTHDLVPGPDAPPFKRLRAAHEWFKRAVERAPDCRRCWDGIALFHAEHPDGDANEGLHAIEQAGPVASFSFIHAQLRLNNGELDMAETIVRRIIVATHQPEVISIATKLLKDIESAREH